MYIMLIINIKRVFDDIGNNQKLVADKSMRDTYN